MTSHLFIGDVHARPDDLDDCTDLMNGVAELLAGHPEVSDVWFLGDQFHTHAMVHVDVICFWQQWALSLSSRGLKIHFLVGNHDLAPSGNHALQALLNLCRGVDVIDQPREVLGMYVVPYMASTAFQEAVWAAPNKGGTLVCHATFAGAQFENGFYAPEGINPTGVPFTRIISGHIHQPQTLHYPGGEVIYFGSPRWVSLNDANSERFVHLVTTDASGAVLSTKAIPPGQWCKRIVRMEVTPESISSEAALVGNLVPGDEYHFDLKGAKGWCEDAARLYSPFGRVRTFPETTRVVHVRESEGVGEAFRKFLEGYTPKHTSLERLKAMVKERFQ